MRASVLNDWERERVIHQRNILEFEFLKEHEYITPIEDGYYYLNTPFETVESDLYDSMNAILMKKLNIENVGKELKDLIAKYNGYNEIKDVADELCGRLADLRGVTIKDIHDELGMPKED